MLQLGSLAFASPWVLAALASLPVLWWLLRVTPPAPRSVDFPAIRLLLALRPQEQTPARTPLWLVILRLLLAALIIFGFAQPLLHPDTPLTREGAVYLIVDDGWASASRWDERVKTMTALIDQAEREDRPLRILATAPSAPDRKPEITGLLRAESAREYVRALAPRAWDTDRAGAIEAIDKENLPEPVHVAWLSDGVKDAASARFAERLGRLGTLNVYLDRDSPGVRLVKAPRTDGDTLVVPLLRLPENAAQQTVLRAVSEDGRLLARETATFAAGAGVAEARLTLPGELRNNVARLEIENDNAAGSLFLLDERWRRRPVGLASGETAEASQPLLSSLYYLNRALAPFSEVREGTVNDLLQRELAVLILADIGNLTNNTVGQLGDWVSQGGVVVRFAGPKLAEGSDGFIPVRLRGGRALGGTMSWAEPARVRPFGDDSPFAGLAIPEDIRIQQQVLAEPSIDLNDKTWVRLTDGTPLVTAERRGRGWLILVHTTANTDWSNLPLSGLFVEMLKRVVGLSQGVVGETADAVYPPLQSVDGFGKIGPPLPTASAIRGADFDKARAGPLTPPGYYGRETARRALNLSEGIDALQPLDALPASVDVLNYTTGSTVDIKPWLLLAALLLLLADLVIAYLLRGVIPVPASARARGSAAAVIVLVAAAALFHAPPAGAQALLERGGNTMPTGPDAKALAATLETRLAYVLTGDPSIDEVSLAGLKGLSRVLRRRTAIEPGDPMGVDIESDVLAFFPLLYWPVSVQQPALSNDAIVKINEFLRYGGTILFDTREQSAAGASFGQGGEASGRLRFLLNRLDIPSLIPAPADHVLTKAFYLIQEFPGRWTGGPLWVERRGGRHNDGVSSVAIGSNDWAGAWAVDDFGTPMFPVVPGGELQRETAYRFGVNWVMYALTGNYKTDQVHVPAIFERLGQ